MPHIETLQVNDKLADPAAPPESPVHERLKEVEALGWVATSELTEFGNYRPYLGGPAMVVPSRDPVSSEHHERVVTLEPGSSFDDPLAEVSLLHTDAQRTRAFLAKSESPNPRTKRHEYWLKIFRSPDQS